MSAASVRCICDQVGLRERKHRMVMVFRARALAAKLDAEQTATFEMMIRRARNEVEQDQVLRAFDDMMAAWKVSVDRAGLTRVMRGFLEEGDEEVDDYAERLAMAKRP